MLIRTSNDEIQYNIFCQRLKIVLLINYAKQLSLQYRDYSVIPFQYSTIDTYTYG